MQRISFMNTYQKEKKNNASDKNLFTVLSNHKLSYKKIILKFNLN